MNFLNRIFFCEVRQAEKPGAFFGSRFPLSFI